MPASARPRASLRSSGAPLTTAHDVALLDLDGVVYLGEEPVAGAPAALAAARAAGMRLAFVTNNAARTAVAVAEKLSRMGVPAVEAEVTTSAQAAAHHLADRFPAGSAVLVVGGEGLRDAVRRRGLEPVDDAAAEPVAVVQGFDPSVGWAQLAEAAVAIRAGAAWVATNIDSTLPSPRGPLPGNGSLVAALGHALGQEPVSTGKPDATMHRESVERSQARRPVVVGDRLDTDVAGAVAAGAPSLLVFTGIADAEAVLAATPTQRPSYLGRDLGSLAAAHPGVGADDGGRVRCGRWEAAPDTGTAVVLTVAAGPAGGVGDGADDPGGAEGVDDDLDALRAVVVAVWVRADESAAGGGGAATRPEVTGGDPESLRVLRAWGLS